MRKRLSINLISRDNGAGLSIDMQLLDAMLSEAGHSVERVSWEARSMRRCDVGIFLELWNPTLAQFATSTIGAFNLEWFEDRWKRDLRSITQLWAKSLEAYEIFHRMGLPVWHTGFLTRNLYDPDIPRTTSCLHLRGRSTMKGTDTVIEAWRRNPDLPPLTIISASPLRVPANVTVLPRLHDTEVGFQVNRHRIHLCPSESEGWGHYITEALSAGAHVITTDASPMNEHVRPAWGQLLAPIAHHSRGMVYTHTVTADAVADAVRRAAALSDVEHEDMSAKAREHSVQANMRFTSTALDLLERL